MGGTYDESLYKIPFVLNSCLYNRETKRYHMFYSSVSNPNDTVIYVIVVILLIFYRS